VISQDPNERLEKLEISVTHLEKLYDELNKAVVEQNRFLAKLNQQLQRISQSMEDIEGERIRATNAKPPHYQ
jgi:uncharacterized coiled-coil protein SlyX